ncbi:MAG: nucleotide exchange factor GrpE [Candidatus Methanomethylophilus sp.]|nr:nucleotide exchange factor GrpE [Methanomethylophilus sp.]MBQ2486523.1 nucleotide exchange factor GrpE [Methanomethylophilus sp.]MBQ4368489.1 nucleotide exchange factor GrpE [Methanomethylophilus sp.]MBQ4411584.1 nucleotide exchange factor GrpE [Methanomethylophilus sp.]MBQ5397185.1 nucleotide exchange factor GrpE [Methanomethylophilus sp.]
MTGKSKEKTEAPSEEKEVEETPEEPTLEAQLEQAKAEAAENLDRWQRTFAEFDNYRKRTEKEMADFRKFANSGLVTELLNVVDDLGRALESAPDAESSLAVGVKAVRGNLVKILEAQGVSEVPTDKGFDPNMHEALMVVDGEEDDKIAQVYQKGYMMNGRVLRFAKVVVTKKKEQEAAPEQDEKTAENNTEN